MYCLQLLPSLADFFSPNEEANHFLASLTEKQKNCIYYLLHCCHEQHNQTTSINKRKNNPEMGPQLDRLSVWPLLTTLAPFLSPRTLPQLSTPSSLQFWQSHNPPRSQSATQGYMCCSFCQKTEHSPCLRTTQPREGKR